MASANEKAEQLSDADTSETCHTCSKPSSDDPLPEDRAKHIPEGDKTGGGHRAGTGKPGKTEFPKDWSDEKILDSVRDVAKNGEIVRPARRPEDVVKSGNVDGVRIETIVRPNGQIRTGYPVDGPGVVRNPK